MSNKYILLETPSLHYTCDKVYTLEVDKRSSFLQIIMQYGVKLALFRQSIAWNYCELSSNGVINESEWRFLWKRRLQLDNETRGIK